MYEFLIRVKNDIDNLMVLKSTKHKNDPWSNDRYGEMVAMENLTDHGSRIMTDYMIRITDPTFVIRITATLDEVKDKNITGHIVYSGIFEPERPTSDFYDKLTLWVQPKL